MKIIAAVDSKRGIARNGQIPWYISDDLRRFKRLTKDGDVIMGSETFERLGKPLKDRRNIVLSATKTYPDVTMFSSFAEAAAQYPDAWVIGGAKMYAQALPFADEMLITHVMKDYECDVFFPNFTDYFTEDSRSSIMTADDIKYYYYVHYRRK